MKRVALFATEADLCAAFIANIGDGWTAYAETEGWDILLVRKVDGCQIGIEAKLKLNAHVLAQSIDSLSNYWRKQGPDYRAVLVPGGACIEGVGPLAEHIGITVLSVRGAFAYRSFFDPALPTPAADGGWHFWSPVERHRLPEFIPDVAAGASAPLQLTQWKVKALKLEAMLEIRGVVQRADFKALQLDPRRWTDRFPGWLRPTPDGYVAGALPNFKAQHPKVYAELIATAADWLPAATVAPPHQPKLIGSAA